MMTISLIPRGGLLPACRSIPLREGESELLQFFIETPNRRKYSIELLSRSKDQLCVSVKEMASERELSFTGSIDRLPHSLTALFGAALSRSSFSASRLLCSFATAERSFGELKKWSEESGRAPEKKLLEERVDGQRFILAVDPSSPSKGGAAKELYDEIGKRLSSSEALTSKEVAGLYERLFGGDLKEESESHIHERAHPASVVYYLHEFFSHYESDSGGALMAIGEKEKGVGGAYFLMTAKGERAWVFKPADEEPGGKNSDEKRCANGIEPGKGALREHVADSINELSGGFFPIPKTVLIALGERVGSAQAFAPNCGSAKRYSQGEEEDPEKIAKIKAEPLLKSIAFDILFRQGDRHDGNLLIDWDGEGFLTVMIDHGMILSSDPGDEVKIEQTRYPQSRCLVPDSIAEFVKNAPFEEWKKLFQNEGIEQAAIDIAEKNLAFFQSAIEASEASIARGGPGIEIRDIALLSIALREEIAKASPEELKGYTSFLSSFKEGLSDWVASRSGGKRSAKASTFHGARARLKCGRYGEFFKTYGLLKEPSCGFEAFGKFLDKEIIPL